MIEASKVKNISVILFLVLISTMSVNAIAKSNFILSGKPGSGKSTIVEKVSEILKKEGIPFSGFYTKECRTGGNRFGFDVIDLNTKSIAPLARISEMAKFEGPRIGKYVVDIKSFEAALKPIFSNFDHLPSILILDEIGKMELLSSFFQSLIKDLFKPDASFTTLITLPEKRDNFPSIRNICNLPSSKIIEVNLNNRNLLPEMLAKDIIQIHKNSNRS